MRKSFALVLLLPFLLTGCLEIFFASPMELGGGSGGWEEMGQVLPSIGQTPTDLVLAFGNNGTGCCVVNEGDNNILFRTPGTDWSGGSTALSDTAESFSLLFKQDNTPYLFFYNSPVSFQLQILSNKSYFSATNINVASAGKTTLANDYQQDRLLYAFNSDSNIFLNRETSPGAYSNIYNTSLLSAPDTLHLMGRNNGDLLLCFSTNNRTVLLRTYSNGVSPVYIPDNTNSGPVQGAIYNPENDIIYTANAAVSGAQKLILREIPASASDYTWWRNTPFDATISTNADLIRMARHCTTGAMYLGYRNPVTKKVSILKHTGTKWRLLAGPFPDTEIGNYALAVNPTDNCLWMVATTNPDGGAIWDLYSWRYVE